MELNGKKKKKRILLSAQTNEKEVFVVVGEAEVIKPKVVKVVIAEAICFNSQKTL